MTQPGSTFARYYTLLPRSEVIIFYRAGIDNGAVYAVIDADRVYRVGGETKQVGRAQPEIGLLPLRAVTTTRSSDAVTNHARNT